MHFLKICISSGWLIHCYKQYSFPIMIFISLLAVQQLLCAILVLYLDMMMCTRIVALQSTAPRIIGRQKAIASMLSSRRRRLFLSTSSTTDDDIITSTAIDAIDDNNHKDEKLVEDMLCRIRQCNYMPHRIQSTNIDFIVDGRLLGKVRPSMANTLCTVCPPSMSGPAFEMAGVAVVEEETDEHDDDESLTKPLSSYLTLSKEHSGTTKESRTQAVAAVMKELKDRGVVTGWRNELYHVSDSFDNPPVFFMERAAMSTLGVLEYGVHINGIVQPQPPSTQPASAAAGPAAAAGAKMWIARRSKTKSKYPGMLDQIVAGGQPAGLSLMENVLKECEEEAGIPPELTRNNVYANGAISYETYDSKRDKISRVVLFNFDLFLPSDFIPTPVDGEVEEFLLWSMDEVKASIALDFADPIKPNCYICIIDYLVRMGLVSPDTKGYLDLVRELRSGDCR